MQTFLNTGCGKLASFFLQTAQFKKGSQLAAPCIRNNQEQQIYFSNCTSHFYADNSNTHPSYDVFLRLCTVEKVLNTRMFLVGEMNMEKLF
jgi:hypothetical protein